MTPELLTACELVFQEHKASRKPIHWDKDAFRGRLSFGLSALAKQTLERRNIICTPNPQKKTITILNPAAATAASFEEAEGMIQNKIPVLLTNKSNEAPAYIPHRIPGSANSIKADRPLKIKSKSTNTSTKLIVWLTPLFYYFAWLVCGVVAGGLITYLLGLLI